MQAKIVFVALLLILAVGCSNASAVRDREESARKLEIEKQLLIDEWNAHVPISNNLKNNADINHRLDELRALRNRPREEHSPLFTGLSDSEANAAASAVTIQTGLYNWFSVDDLDFLLKTKNPYSPKAQEIVRLGYKKATKALDDDIAICAQFKERAESLQRKIERIRRNGS